MKKLGFGAMRLPIKNENSSDIDLDSFKEMVDYYLSNGFNYFDTAYMYHDGMSEIAIREALVKRYPRESFSLTDKMPIYLTRVAEDYDKIFNEQLERCGVSYFDIYLLHAINESMYLRVIKNDGFKILKRFKEQGKIRHIGFSFHDNAELLDKILTDNPCVEYVQLQINYVDWESEVIQSRKCYEVALKHNKKILVMEPIKGGTLANLPPKAEELLKSYNLSMSVASWAIRYVASLDNVYMVLSGMSNLEQLKDNVSYMKQFIPLNESEKEIILKVKDIINKSISVACTACRYCVSECPKKIPIADYFSLLNDKMQLDTFVPSMYYNQLAKNNARASECIGCKKCESICPQKIEISRWIREVSRVFDKK